MSYNENQDKYLRLFLNFSNLSMSAIDFERGFSKLWESDRDEEYENIKKWDHPYDIELINELKQGKISKDEFSNRWCDLFGLTNDMFSVRSILDRAYTTCNCFWPSIPDDEVDPPLMLNEKLFREEILGLMNELDSLIKINNIK